MRISCFASSRLQPPILVPTGARARQISRILKVWSEFRGLRSGIEGLSYSAVPYVVCEAVLWRKCGGGVVAANVPYCTASDCPVREIQSRPVSSCLAMPSLITPRYAIFTRTKATRTTPLPRVANVYPSRTIIVRLVRQISHLAHTIDSRSAARRRHAYLTPQLNSTPAHRPSPIWSVSRPSLRAQDKPAIPVEQRVEHAWPRKGPSTLSAHNSAVIGRRAKRIVD